MEGRESKPALAELAADAPRGSRRLELAHTRGLAPGQDVRLMMDDPDGTLGRHIHADRLDAHPTLKNRRLARFPARIESIQGNTVNLDTRFHHDLTVENATGTVFMRGSGVDLCFDHHTHIPYENLFTEIDIGAGTRPWLSNGSRDPESGARETFWNIRSRKPVHTLVTRKGLWPEMNLIGVETTLKPTSKPGGPWIETIPPCELDPPNLYLDQLARRLGARPSRCIRVVAGFSAAFKSSCHHRTRYRGDRAISF